MSLVRRVEIANEPSSLSSSLYRPWVFYSKRLLRKIGLGA
jgi:hypothetical protein